jgi:hypothetical protein
MRNDAQDPFLKKSEVLAVVIFFRTIGQCIKVLDNPIELG